MPGTCANIAEQLNATLKIPAAGLTRTTLRELAADGVPVAEVAVDLSEDLGILFTQAELREVVYLGSSAGCRAAMHLLCAPEGRHQRYPRR